MKDIEIYNLKFVNIRTTLMFKGTKAQNSVIPYQQMRQAFRADREGLSSSAQQRTYSSSVLFTTGFLEICLAATEICANCYRVLPINN